MSIRIKLDEGVKMPTKAHEDDAGWDLYARETQMILPGERVKFDTGVHIEIPLNCVGFIKSRSGLMVNHGILTDGTIDCGYTGSIGVTLFNLSKEKYTVHKGDKIAQLVVAPFFKDYIEMVDSLGETDRGENGFGSSGR